MMPVNREPPLEMKAVQCEACKAHVPSYDITHCGSIDDGYRALCGPCFNAHIADMCGLDDFDNCRIEPIRLTDGVDKSHEFHFTTRLLGDIVSMDAFEVMDGERGGYEFCVIGTPEDDRFEVLGRLVEKIRRGIAVKYLSKGPRSVLQIANQSVCGWINSDFDKDERTPMLVIDGQEIPWEKLGHMLMSFEGWQFRLEIVDRSDDTQ